MSPPPTRRMPAFGYLRSAEPEEAKLSILRGEMVLHAGRHNLDLTEVFEDVPCTGLTLRRPGLTRLLKALSRHDNAVAVLPARCHLSWRSAIRQQLERRITDTGATLLVIWGNDERPELRP